MEARPYIGWENPVALGGATGPPPPARDLFANSKKNYIEVLSLVAWATGPLSPLGRATGGHFRNFSKRTYIFEFFLNIKKKKLPAPANTRHVPACCCTGPIPQPTPLLTSPAHLTRSLARFSGGSSSSSPRAPPAPFTHASQASRNAKSWPCTVAPLTPHPCLRGPGMPETRVRAFSRAKLAKAQRVQVGPGPKPQPTSQPRPSHRACCLVTVLLGAQTATPSCSRRAQACVAFHGAQHTEHTHAHIP